MPELRTGFHRELDKLDIAVGALLDLIPDSIRTATTALLNGDEDGSAEVARWRALIDDLYADVEHTAEGLVARQAPVAGDLRFVFACVRLAPHLHDAVELIAEIASPARTSVAPELTDRLSELLVGLGDTAADAWSVVADGWERKDASCMAAVSARDDAISDLCSTVSAVAASGVLGVGVAMEVALVGRCYERLGRYAVLAAQRMEPLIVVPRPAG